MDSIRKSVTSRSSELSSYLFSTCEAAFGVFGPVLDILKSVWQRATRMMKVLDHFSHEESLRAGGAHTGGEKAEGEIFNAYKHLKGGCRGDRARLFPVVLSDRTKGTN